MLIFGMRWAVHGNKRRRFHRYGTLYDGRSLADAFLFTVTLVESGIPALFYIKSSINRLEGGQDRRG